MYNFQSPKGALKHYYWKKFKGKKIGLTCLKTFYKFTLDMKIAVHLHARGDIDAPKVTISFRNTYFINYPLVVTTLLVAFCVDFTWMQSLF